MEVPMETLRSPRVAGRTFRLHWLVQANTQITEEYIFHVDGSMSFAPVMSGSIFAVSVLARRAVRLS